MTLAYIDLGVSIDPETGIPVWDAENPTAVDENGEFHFRAERVDNFARAVRDRAYRELDKDGDRDGVSFRVRKVMARADE